jgi:hypothetical protein
MTAEIIRDLPSAEYHARPELSSSGARTILKSPARFDWERKHPVFKDVYDFGSAAHAIVLGDESTLIVEVAADDWRTKAAREAKDEARALGRVPLLTKELTVVRDMADAIRKHPVAAALLTRPGESEVSVVWDDRRARFDRLPEVTPGRRPIATDYKTAVDASEAAFMKSVADYGYHQQDDWYTDALRAMGLDDAAFVFVVQEKTAPYLVNVIELDVEAKRIGHERNARAIDLWRECTATDTWPGYGDDVKTIGLPRWAVIQHEESAA